RVHNLHGLARHECRATSVLCSRRGLRELLSLFNHVEELADLTAQLELIFIHYIPSTSTDRVSPARSCSIEMTRTTASRSEPSASVPTTGIRSPSWNELIGAMG